MIDCTRCELKDDCPGSSEKIKTVKQKKDEIACNGCQRSFCPAENIAEDGNKKQTEEAIQNCTHRYWTKLRKDFRNFLVQNTDLEIKQLGRVEKGNSSLDLFKKKLCRQHGGVQ